MSWKKQAKTRAAIQAINHVKSGMIIGLGSGSTAAQAIRILGEKLQTQEITDIRGVPTSYQAIQEAVKARVPLTTLDEYPQLDLGFDGADQLDNQLNAIKGGGGALLREKIVASCCKEYIIIADISKKTETLGDGQPIYLEVHPFALTPVLRKIEKMGAQATVRQATGKLGPVVTDNGNNLIDALFGPIPNLRDLNQRLHSVQGLMETGLFIGYADVAYLGTEDGVVKLVK